MSIKTGQEVLLNDKPTDGHRKAVWDANWELNHHVVKLTDGYGNSVALFNGEIDKLYEFLGEVLFYKDDR